MTDALKALEDALRFYADPNRWPNMPNPENPHYDVEMDAGSVARSALSLLPTLRAALAPPADVAGDVEAIRARHEACGHIIEWPDFESFEAHNDRATLLHRVDALASELALVTAERNRAQTACEQMGERITSLEAELAAERARGERMREALNTIGNSLVCAPTDYAEHNASELLKAGNIARAALKETGQ